MEGMSSNFGGTNAAAMLQMSNYGNIQQQAVQQQQQQNSQPELTPHKKAVFDRLKKRLNGYRKRQNETIPRFDQTFNGICEQQSMETNLLQKKFLESKAKRVAKKSTDKKQSDVVGNVAVSKKRPAPDDLENEPDLVPPSAKIPQTQQQPQSNPTMDNMKFQVEIVQQLEFTTSAVNMQAQQISTNVTVKTTANGISQEMKPKIKELPQIQSMPPQQPQQDLLQDFKQEPDNEFADLDFGGIANFMANDENELKKLFSNISEVFDQTDLFDDTKIKQEPMTRQQMPQMQMPQQQNQFNQFSQYVMPDMQMQKQQMMQQPMRMYPQQQAPMQQMPDITPAAQTLKNMAQQHQVKSSMAMNYMRPQQMPQQPPQMQRMPYQQPPQQQQPQQPAYNDFNQYNQMPMKSQMQMPFNPDMIKQEMMMQQPMMNHRMMHDEQKMQNYQQNFQPQQQQPQFIPQNQQRNFSQNNSMNIHMKQTQMMHIQQGGNQMVQNIQMQGAQHMGMTMNDGNFNMQQQQNMYFNAQQQQQNQGPPPQYGNMQMQQKRLMGQQPHLHHQQQGGGSGGGGPQHGMGDGPANSYNMMQSQSMSFTQ